jgi:hypothetical protein
MSGRRYHNRDCDGGGEWYRSFKHDSVPLFVLIVDLFES